MKRGCPAGYHAIIEDSGIRICTACGNTLSVEGGEPSGTFPWVNMRKTLVEVNEIEEQLSAP